MGLQCGDGFARRGLDRVAECEQAQQPRPVGDVRDPRHCPALALQLARAGLQWREADDRLLEEVFTVSARARFGEEVVAFDILEALAARRRQGRAAGEPAGFLIDGGDLEIGCAAHAHLWAG